MPKRFYITTPIYYVSDVPHLGHAYTTVVADTLARYHRLRGADTRFLTGTDEHGQKIARLAEDKGLTPRAFADQFADAYQRTWKTLGISHDDFIRTTDPDHETCVQDIWRRLEKSGDLYLADYEGWYCVACEQFYTEKELLPGSTCPVHKKPVEKVKEQSYYFRLSKYREPLLRHYAEHPKFIQPKERMNEVRAFVEGDLRDLSVSRTTFKWGVPVPDHPRHVIYVWIDALSNYYSATLREKRVDFWGDDVEIVHLMGKEISRFHAVYWPAMLMSAGLRLPSTVFCHGWWTVDGEKMSKTLGNVVDPLKLSADLGVDAFRYFVLREVPLGADGDFSHEALLTRYNAELANDLGNLLNRTLGMVDKYFGAQPIDSAKPELQGDAESARDQTAAELEALSPSTALQAIWALVRRCNTYVDQAAPWNADAARRGEILWNILECLRFLSNLLEPFMPERAGEIRRQIGRAEEKSGWPVWTPGARYQVKKGAPLFPRIEDDRKAELLGKWRPAVQTAEGSGAGAGSGSGSGSGQITYDDFQKLDLRVGRVTAAEAVPKAKKLLKLKVDLGSEQRQVVAGIAESYQPDELIGKSVVFLANLKPATIRGVLSEGMILAAGDETVLALSALDRTVPPGTKVR